MLNFVKLLLLKVEIKISDCNEKPKSECTQCRQRKPSQSADKIDEHLPPLVSEKPMPMNNECEKPPKSFTSSSADSTDYIGNFIGPIGKWQLRTIFLIYLTKIPASWFMACVSHKKFFIYIFSSVEKICEMCILYARLLFSLARF